MRWARLHNTHNCNVHQLHFFFISNFLCCCYCFCFVRAALLYQLPFIPKLNPKKKNEYWMCIQSEFMHDATRAFSSVRHSLIAIIIRLYNRSTWLQYMNNRMGLLNLLVSGCIDVNYGIKQCVSSVALYLFIYICISNLMSEKRMKWWLNVSCCHTNCSYSEKASFCLH